MFIKRKVKTDSSVVTPLNTRDSLEQRQLRARRRRFIVRGLMFAGGALFLAALISVFNEAAEKLGAGTAVLLFSIWAVVILLVLKYAGVFSKARKKREAREANQEILRKKEVLPSPPILAAITSYGSKEEEDLNIAFRKSIYEAYNIKRAEAHCAFLKERLDALHALKSENEYLTQVLLNEAYKDLEQTKSEATTKFDSKWCNMMNQATEVMKAYSEFAEILPNVKTNWVSDFFQSPKTKVLKLADMGAYVFTPSYLVFYQGVQQRLHVIPYSKVSITSELYTEQVAGRMYQSDEIAQIKYLYSNADGSRDRRYKNNPQYTFVYRGRILINTPFLTAHINKNNKTETETFIDRAKGFLDLIQGKYKSASERLISHDESFVNFAIDAINKFQEGSEQKNEESVVKNVSEHLETSPVMSEPTPSPSPELAPKPTFAQNTVPAPKPEFSVSYGVIVKWNKDEKNAVIRKDIADTIGAAFRKHSNLESIVIPEGITTIQEKAFESCSNLMRIDIPNTVECIERGAFEKCSALTSIVLPEGLEEIEDKLFAECTSLKTVVIPKDVYSIGTRAFYCCSSLEEVILPEGLDCIEDKAFQNCTSLKRVVIPNSVTSLGDDIFSGCHGLKSVVLGDGIEQIPDGFFKGLQELTVVSISSELEGIGDEAFRGCRRLQRIILNRSNGVESRLEWIGEAAFEGCVSLDEFELPDGIESIGDNAFAGCESLREAHIPDAIDSFGVGVFQGCTSLREVTGFENTEWKQERRFLFTPWLEAQSENGFLIEDDYLEAYVGTQSSVEIPKSVKTIGEAAFAGNGFLTEVVIPNGVRDIEGHAFSDCKRLKMVEIPDSVLWIANDAFWGSPKVVFRCTRGSVASSYRIQNGIQCEYVSKANGVGEPPRRNTYNPPQTVMRPVSGLEGLSEEEIQIILELRRKKKESPATVVKAPEPPKPAFQIVERDSSRIDLALKDDRRKITNSIFNLRFEQEEPAGGTKSVTEYEVFIADSDSNIISNIVTITTDSTGEDLSHKAKFTLSSKAKLDKNSVYYLIIRYKGADLDILNKLKYQIDIAFVPDF